jgi:hypothetical protein
MDKGDAGAPAPVAGGLVDETGALFFEVVESIVYRCHGEGNVMETFPVFVEKTADRGIGPQRLQKLDERPTDRDHRLLDPLAFDCLPIQRLDAITLSIAGEGVVEIIHGYCHVIQIEQLHPQRLLRPWGGVTLGR